MKMYKNQKLKRGKVTHLNWTGGCTEGGWRLATAARSIHHQDKNPHCTAHLKLCPRPLNEGEWGPWGEIKRKRKTLFYRGPTMS